MLGYKAKQGYVIYRARVRRGCFVRHVAKGQTMGKPTRPSRDTLFTELEFEGVALSDTLLRDRLWA